MKNIRINFFLFKKNSSKFYYEKKITAIFLLKKSI